MAIAIGSTAKLGTGTNVQDKVTAMHHLDVPWMPADVEQRDGRGWRHRNENTNLDVFHYVSEKSLDQTFWQIIGTKAGFIKQVLTPGNKLRNIKNEDTETLTPEHLNALASGDPRMLEMVNLVEDVKALKASHERHGREGRKLEQPKDIKRRIPSFERNIAELEQDTKHLEKHPDYAMELNGQKFENAAANEALHAYFADKGNGYRDFGKAIGTFRGMKMILGGDISSPFFRLQTPDGHFHNAQPSSESIEYVTRNIPKQLEVVKADLAHQHKNSRLRAGRDGRTFTRSADIVNVLPTPSCTHQFFVLVGQIRLHYLQLFGDIPGHIFDRFRRWLGVMKMTVRRLQPEKWTGNVAAQNHLHAAERTNRLTEIPIAVTLVRKVGMQCLVGVLALLELLAV